MERKRYIADSKEPKKMRAPVRKRLPMEADRKLKEDLGRWRFRSSKFRRMKNERRSSRFSEEICNRDRVIACVWDCGGGGYFVTYTLPEIMGTFYY